MHHKESYALASLLKMQRENYMATATNNYITNKSPPPRINGIMHHLKNPKVKLNLDIKS